jgi:ribonuclease P protein component
MLSRAHRLTDNKDFQTIYRRGRYNATALLSVNVLRNKYGVTKIGIVASKKAAKKAHDRNAMKRKVREAARLVYPRLKNAQSIIISIKAPAMKADYKTLEKDLLGSLKRLGLFLDEDTK